MYLTRRTTAATVERVEAGGDGYCGSARAETHAPSHRVDRSGPGLLAEPTRQLDTGRVEVCDLPAITAEFATGCRNAGALSGST